MAASTFERKIEIKEPEYVQRLFTLMEDDRPVSPLSDHSYTEDERERNVELFKQSSYLAQRCR